MPVDLDALERAGRLSGMPYPDWWAAGLERRLAHGNALASPQVMEVKDANLLASP